MGFRRVVMPRPRLPSVGLLLVLASAMWTPGACALGCRDALLGGVLVADGEELVLREPYGFVRSVTWPWGYSVRSDAGRLHVTDIFGTVKAAEGDSVELPGGEAFGDGPWEVCGETRVVGQ